GGTERHLDGDEDAAFERIDDPAEAAQRGDAIHLPGILRFVHRVQHPLEDRADVVVSPVLGLARDRVNLLRRREVGAANPDVDGDRHASSASSAARSVTGAWHVKSRQTYAAGRPWTSCMPAINGSFADSSLC